MSSVHVSPEIVEFFNTSHSHADGKFTTSGTGGGHYKGRSEGKKQTAAQKHQPGGPTKGGGSSPKQSPGNIARAKEAERVQRGPAPPPPGAAMKSLQKAKLQRIMERSPHAPPKPGERLNEYTKRSRGPTPPKPGETNKDVQAKYDADKKAHDVKQARKADYDKRGPTPPKPGEAGGKAQEKYDRQRKVWQGHKTKVSLSSDAIIEFYNSHHAKSDGRFTSGGSGKGSDTDWHRVGTDSKYASERGMSLPVLPSRAAPKHIPFTPTTAKQNAQFREEIADLAKKAGQSKTAPDAPTYKGQAAVRRAISKSSDEHGHAGAFELTLKNGQRTEISVLKTDAKYIHGKGGFGDARVAFKDVASAKPLGIATNNGKDHMPFKSGGVAHTQNPVRKHTTPNFIETNKTRHVKSMDDWTKPGGGSRHPAGETGHTKVKVRKGLFGK